MTEPQLTLFKHGVIAARMEATTPGSAWHPFCLDTPSPLWPKHSGQHRSVVYCRGRRGGWSEFTWVSGLRRLHSKEWCVQLKLQFLMRREIEKHATKPEFNAICSVFTARRWYGWVGSLINEWVRQAHQGPKSYTTSGSRALQRSADRWEWKWAGRELILIWLAQLIQSLHSPVYMQTHF